MDTLLVNVIQCGKSVRQVDFSSIGSKKWQQFFHTYNADIKQPKDGESKGNTAPFCVWRHRLGFVAPMFIMGES